MGFDINTVMSALHRLIIGDDGRIFSPSGTGQQVNKLGNQISLAGPIVGSRVPLPGQSLPADGSVQMQGILEARATNPYSPSIFTVDLAQPIYDGSLEAFSTDTPVLDLKARIEWGAGGFSHVADVDFISGTQLTVMGSLVRVTAYYGAPFPAVPPVAAPLVQLAASVSYGPRSGSAVAPCWTYLTDPITTPGDTFPNDIIIPPFAKDVTIFATNTEPGLFPFPPVAVLLSSQASAIATVVCPAGDATTIPIPGMTKAVRIFNPAGNAITSFTLRFGLSL